ncbi:MAG: metal ABC transporter permease, partial [Litorilinea sp.]
PAAAAQLLTQRLPTMMAIAATIGAISNLTGLYLSYYVNVASGPAMVLVATAIFILVFVFAPRRGMIWRWMGTQSGTQMGTGESAGTENAGTENTNQAPAQ